MTPEPLSTVSLNEANPNSALIQKLKTDVHRRLLESLDLTEAQRLPVEELHHECSRRVDALLNEQRFPLSASEKQRIIHELMDEIFGLGPIETLLSDKTVSDILVNGAKQIYVERFGNIERTDVTFRDDKHLLQVIHRIAANVGRRIDESSPMLDARLLDGSRVNAVIPPLSLRGPALSIRRFGTIPINIESLVRLGTMASEMVDFLESCVQCKLNILISGGTGTGKTTMLNALSKWIPDHERIITIEDAAELQLQQEHIVSLETRPANIEGQGKVTQRDLLRNSLRMRPDRIVIGEVRGPETLDMLQAMNTGHEGSMTTVHSNNSRDALRRIENMVSMAGLGYPIHVIREQVASALNLLIHLERVTGGGRKIASISEVTGMEGETICLQELFRYKQTGIDANGQAEGFFEACGVRPHVLNRLHEEGIDIPPEVFQRHVCASGA